MQKIRNFNFKIKLFQYRNFLLDIFSYNLLVFICLKFLNINLKFHNIFFYYQFLWYLQSYLIGRYNSNLIIEYFYTSRSLLKIFVNFFLTLNFSYILIILVYSSVDLGIFVSTALAFLILSLGSFLLQFFLYLLVKKYFRSPVKWLFVGNQNNFNYLIEINKLLKYKYEIDYISSLEEINQIDHKIYYGIIIDNQLIFENSFIKKLSLKNKIIFNYKKWFESYFYSIPGDFISKKNLIFNNEFPNRISLELRIKRTIDIILSILILIISSPLIIIFSILIFIQDGSSPLYSQVRTGLDEKKIRIWKLRSMKINSEENGPQWSKRNDKRITKVGHFIRKTRIDELPQLISVIVGDMSLIGPRPERPEIDKILVSKINNYKLRYQFKPGLSGWAQVNYPYGASIKDSEIKLGYDLFYIYKYSFWLDFKILFKTIQVVLNPKNAIPKY